MPYNGDAMRAPVINLREVLGGDAATDDVDVTALAFDATGERLAVGAGRWLAVVDAADGGRLAAYRDREARCRFDDVRFADGGRCLVARSHEVGALDGAQWLWAFELGAGAVTVRVSVTPRRRHEFDGQIELSALSPDGAWLAASAGGSQNLWQLSTGRPVAPLGAALGRLEAGGSPLPRGTACAALGPGGDALALWAAAPSGREYLDYGDRLAVIGLATGEHVEADLYDERWFTTQVERHGRRLFAFSKGGDALVGATWVVRHGRAHAVSFAYDVRGGGVLVTPTPLEAPLEPYAIEGGTPAVLWSDARAGRSPLTVLRQDLAAGEHAFARVPSAGRGPAGAVALSDDGALVARAVRDDVYVVRAF